MIPLSVPNISGNEWKYVKDCLDTGWVSSVGSYVSKFEEEIAKFCGVKKAIATSNGTTALHISLLLAGVERGDLVVLPNITFVAPANVIKYAGADPILIDIDKETWQMDLHLLENFLKKETTQTDGACFHKKSGKRISALLPVHVLGVMCDIDKLLELSEAYHIPVVEDSTEALGSFYKGKQAGSFGLFGCLSFNGNKIMTTGGGGMIMTNNEALAVRAKHLTTQAKSKPDEYYHDEVGFNYRLVNILAAMGVAQLEQLPAFLERKKVIADTYNAILQKMPGCFPQQTGKDVSANNWLYTVYTDDQTALRKHMLADGIEVRPFWVPMNQLPAFKDDLYVNSNDVSNDVYSHCLSLPCSSGITDEELVTVVNSLKRFFND